MSGKKDKSVRMAARWDSGNRKPRPHLHVEQNDMKYLFPYVCFKCRKSFKRKLKEGLIEKICPECGGVSVGLARHFKAPRKKDLKQWEKVEYLVANGFSFSHQYDEEGNLVPYPKTMEEAVIFVKTYGKNALK